MQPQQPLDAEQPVAYDNEGRPLYTHPSAQPVMMAPATSSIETAEQNAKKQRLHQDSVTRFPDINLSTEEYIISEVTRHTIGLVAPILTAIVLGLLIIVSLSSYPVIVPSGNPSFTSLVLPAALLLALIALGTYIIVWTYKGNRFFVTNESVIQQVQVSLFSHNEKTVALSEVKDISYSQTGITQLMFNYGSIKLTTEGDDEVYKFSNVAQPRKIVTMLNSVLEDFKNNRPISEPSIVDLV